MTRLVQNSRRLGQTQRFVHDLILVCLCSTVSLEVNHPPVEVAREGWEAPDRGNTGAYKIHVCPVHCLWITLIEKSCSLHCVFPQVIADFADPADATTKAPIRSIGQPVVVMQYRMTLIPVEDE